MSNVLVVSPHPDDESLGCGGTLRVHVHAGDVVDVLFLTSGEAGGHSDPPEIAGPRREQEARAAADVLGVRQVHFWRQPDGALRVLPELVERLSALVESLRPECVYVTHPGEQHPDHRAAAELVVASVGGSGVPVYFMEVWTPLARIDRVVDISTHMPDKLEAVRAHRSQCAVLDFPSAVEGLNRYRGEMYSWPGGPYAEVFARWNP